MDTSTLSVGDKIEVTETNNVFGHHTEAGEIIEFVELCDSRPDLCIRAVRLNSGEDIAHFSVENGRLIEKSGDVAIVAPSSIGEIEKGAIVRLTKDHVGLVADGRSIRVIERKPPSNKNRWYGVYVTHNAKWPHRIYFEEKHVEVIG